MKTVCEKDMCAGCMACIDICPKQAITIEDSLRSYNAVIEEDKCINCKACHKVCPTNQKPHFVEALMWKQGWASREEVRYNSSSGGIAAALMESFINSSGCVCSCTFMSGNFVFDFADKCCDIKRFVGSKYVKSNPVTIYKKIKYRLINGEKVLFIGLPCQVAAVKNFIGNKCAERLYTIDLICHGTPSQKILDMFLKEYGYSLNGIKDIRFRKKTTFHLYDRGKGILPERVQDNYTFAFLSCLDYTENCYSCKYARKERVGDISLGDSWGRAVPYSESSRGVSLVLCQTDKGQALLESSKIHLEEVNIEKALESNHQLRHPSIAPEKRKRFFEYLDKGLGFNRVILKCYPKMYYKQKLKEILIRAKIIRRE